MSRPVYSFDQGLPDPALFPIEELKAYLVQTLDVDGAAACTYASEGSPEDMQYGYIGLRAEIAKLLARQEGRDVSPEGVLLANGSTNGIALAINAHVGPGDGAVVESMSYPYARRYLEAAGATVATVPLDDDGMDTVILERRCEDLAADGHPPRMIYTIPTYQSPTGTVLPLDRRRHLLEVARRFGTIVLEDNCYYQLFYYEPPPPSLLGLDESGMVLQSGSFSKYLAPGLRMAWIAGPPATVAPLAGVRQDFAVSQLLARALARYLVDGRLESHLELLRGAYRHKHEIAAAALQKHCRPWVRFRVPRGGIYFWLELDDSVDADAALEHAAAGGVRFRPGVRFTGADDGKRFIRLSCVQIPAARHRTGHRRAGPSPGQVTEAVSPGCSAAECPAVPRDRPNGRTIADGMR